MYRLAGGIQLGLDIPFFVLNLMFHAVHVKCFGCDASGRQDVSKRSLEYTPWKRLKRLSWTVCLEGSDTMFPLPLCRTAQGV